MAKIKVLDSDITVLTTYEEAYISNANTYKI